VIEILLQKIMATIANASLLCNLELQRGQELAKARAIQIGMLPQGALRTADRAICAGCGDLARGSQDRRATEGMAPVLLSARGNRELDLRGVPPGMFPETKYDGAIGTRRLDNFSERWILLGAEFRGRILWHKERAGGTRKLAGKFAGGDSAATDGGGGQLMVRPAATG
jgi:hypothetical protein